MSPLLAQNMPLVRIAACACCRLIEPDGATKLPLFSKSFAQIRLPWFVTLPELINTSYGTFTTDESTGDVLEPPKNIEFSAPIKPLFVRYRNRGAEVVQVIRGS